MKKRVYLDAAAAHPLRTRARAAFSRAVSLFGNPSAPHTEGRAALAVLEAARTSIARELGAKSDAVIFTSGATESNALAIEGCVRARIASGASPATLRVLYSPTQHASVIAAVEAVQRLGVPIAAVPLKEGQIDAETLAPLLSTASLITLDVICGETGTRFDTRAVRRLIDALPAHQRPIVHVDATQAALVENMDRTRLGADLISFDAQKIGGVRGIGALIVPSAITLAPLIGGGGQERGLRSGTPSPALASAFASALEESSKERETFSERTAHRTSLLIASIEKEISNTVVNGGKNRAPHIVNISFLGRDTDYLAALLDEAGFAVATRSACETDAEGSRVVLAYTGDAARASSALRVSLSTSVSERDIHAFIKALISAVGFLDASRESSASPTVRNFV